MPLRGPKPTWLTFDCYGTLIQWDEGIIAAMERTRSRRGPINRRRFYSTTPISNWASIQLRWSIFVLRRNWIWRLHTRSVSGASG